MKTSSKFFAVSAFSISLILLNSLAANAATFIDPTIEGRYIDACLESYRFQDGCNRAARDETALQFCRWQGYSSWAQYQNQDFGWDNRTMNWKWQERYVDGQVLPNFYSNEGGNRFTVIECE
jgi:hypothetical protein